MVGVKSPSIVLTSKHDFDPTTERSPLESRPRRPDRHVHPCVPAQPQSQVSRDFLRGPRRVLALFHRAHLEVARRHLAAPVRDPCGTGGAPYVEWLGQLAVLHQPVGQGDPEARSSATGAAHRAQRSRRSDRRTGSHSIAGGQVAPDPRAGDAARAGAGSRSAKGRPFRYRGPGPTNLPIHDRVLISCSPAARRAAIGMALATSFQQSLSGQRCPFSVDPSTGTGAGTVGRAATHLK